MNSSVKKFSLTGLRTSQLFDPRYVLYHVNSLKRYQTIQGFGGAMTDATAMNIATLSVPTQQKLLRQYFGDGSINYSFIRLPIGGTDFSTRYYSLDDVVNDTSLEHFNLTEEDLIYKIPYTKQAMAISKHEIKLFASTWSAPLWMTRPRFSKPSFTKLQEQYRQLHADYHIKFLDAYKMHSLNFWGITAHNEPVSGFLYYVAFNNMGWTPEEQRDWVTNYFGPTLHKSGYGNLKLMILDDQRVFLPLWPTIMMNEEAKKFVSGIAVHFYTDIFPISQASLLSDTHDKFPDLFILNTEACIFPLSGGVAVSLGLWDHAEIYAESIIENINNWSIGWVDWNMALNLDGGPNWAYNNVNAPIIVNATADEFYKQPTFYALAHFSKFVPPESQRIQLISANSKGLLSSSFITPQHDIVIVLVNKLNFDMSTCITAGLKGNIELVLPAHSIHTIIYKNGII
ncbi:lysosomal acid glucosylceramidase-like [Periplaneta americana]|uniref:lysosomal acid glucosylceramidase-like n=1 Tax=Periplaneta americana TaxID=6978 RepID=UPI0037E7141E